MTIMETRLLIRKMLAEAGIAVSAETLDELVPMVLQWRHYIDEARRMEISGEQEPACKLSLDP